MVPYQHSIELLNGGFIKAQTHLFLRDGMEHNRFDYIGDIIKPLRFFIKQTWQEESGLKYAKLFGVGSKSQYFNNFSALFKP
jgi:hypothetical protein